ncbi:MAG TPA: glycosyltransferase [Streptosporangiaceae bacterium]|nr:glycosyltransferase [Streptosporangiaceae bacterium]
MTTRTGVPDVSVIVAVYNTMPYLTTCLTSLVEQSIGRDRMEIIAVDDGSTDGSGKELDRFAERYPQTVRVIHQANSGGPAGPSNRALDAATGRYVYFVGADDHLGAQALERLVNAADQWGSDVVAGKMAGTNGRGVHQGLYKATEPDIDLFDSALPWALNNCKLFRRELIERHGIRYPEDMPVGSDQPFTFAACLHASKISVLADYTCYYAVRRENAGNITYQTTYAARLDCAAKLIEFKAARLEPGPRRDKILRVHFSWELASLLRPEFLDLDRDAQESICRGIGRLADAYLTDPIRDTLDTGRLVRLSLARLGAVSTLCAVIGDDAAGVVPPVVLEAGRAFAGYPGFRTPRAAVPDDCYQVGADLSELLAAGLATSSVRWGVDAEGRPALSISARAALVGPSAIDPAVVKVAVAPVTGATRVPGPRRRPADGPAPAERETAHVTLTASADGVGTDLDVLIPVRRLVTADGGRPRRLAVRLEVDLLGTATHEIPFPTGGGPVSPLRHRHRSRFYVVSVTADDRDRLLIAVRPVRPVRVVGRRLRRPIARVWRRLGGSRR